VPYFLTVRAAASAAYTCPDERVFVRRLPTPASECAPRAPPNDVAADAQRLSLWHEREKARLDRCEEPSDFVIEACGHTAEYHCVWYHPFRERCEVSKLSAEEIRVAYVGACARGDATREGRCECVWSELRKTFSVAELAGAPTDDGSPVVVASRAAASTCQVR
jgi:hypothetical protein